MGLVNCFRCSREFNKQNRHVNENLKLGHRWYCSVQCQSSAKNKHLEVLCDNCGDSLKRTPAEVSPHNFCNHSCFAKYINIRRHTKKCPQGCIEKHLRIEVKRKLSPEERREKQLAGLKKYRENYKSPFTPEVVLTAIKDFAKKNNRLPVKREMSRYYQPSRRLFGTWNEAIEAAGYQPNPVLFAKRQIANDGHVCDSLAEKIIDDWFYARNIRHEIHVKYPDTKFTADFIVNGVVIEFFGLSGELKRYDKLMKDKLRMIQDRALKFISIYPKDIFPISRLDDLLKGVKLESK